MSNWNEYFIINGNDKDGYDLYFKIDNQSFKIDMGPIKPNKKETLWFRQQFKTSLENFLFKET